MAKITNTSTLPILFRSRTGVSSTIDPGVTLTLPDYDVVYDQIDSGVELGWLSVTRDDGSALFDRFGNIVGADPSLVLTASYAKSFTQVAGSPFTLMAAWQKVCTTTAATLGLRLGVPPNPSAYDIEWAAVPAGAAAPTSAIGEGVLAGEDFASGLPIGDIYCKSATLQKLIVVVA